VNKGYAFSRHSQEDSGTMAGKLTFEDVPGNKGKTGW
jgi:hypothetical protein